MNTKLRIKQRREERIRRLMDGAAVEVIQQQKVGSLLDKDEIMHRKPFASGEGIQERDPEWLWKKRTVISVQGDIRDSTSSSRF
ncbi:hypothetical protein P9222_12825 [Paenibacillus amylolyticus]|nr:hypothetical protein [Paenibacillus amylolyticus]WFR64854.1 hypothetical protein P9222_12825 [Paenibacillus amylolyticus]